MSLRAAALGKHSPSVHHSQCQGGETFHGSFSLQKPVHSIHLFSISHWMTDWLPVLPSWMSSQQHKKMARTKQVPNTNPVRSESCNHCQSFQTSVLHLCFYMYSFFLLHSLWKNVSDANSVLYLFPFKDRCFLFFWSCASFGRSGDFMVHSQDSTIVAIDFRNGKVCEANVICFSLGWHSKIQ